jgi:hypothetical protein
MVAAISLGVAGVLPGVGIGLAADVAQPYPLAGVDHRPTEARTSDGVVQPGLQAGAILDHQVGPGDGLDVGRGGFVVVGVDVGLEQAGHPHPVPANLAGEVGHLSGGGNHVEHPTCGEGSIA